MIKYAARLIWPVNIMSKENHMNSVIITKYDIDGEMDLHLHSDRQSFVGC